MKNLLDTADRPGHYRSPIATGWHPRAGSAPVAAGGVVIGKTVTTDLPLVHELSRRQSPTVTG